jgi:hypothetical protein
VILSPYSVVAFVAFAVLSTAKVSKGCKAELLLALPDLV